MLKVEHAWTNGMVNPKSPTSVECTWNKYGSVKKGVTPKLLSDMALEKPHYKKKRQCKVINPSSRKLFQPKRKEKVDNKPNIKSIVSYLYASVPDACAFQYLEMKVSAIYSPENDVNVKDTICVDTSGELPKSIPEVALITPEQISSIELRTMGQNNNENWSIQRCGRITASISRRVLTKVRSLQKSQGKVSTLALVNAICMPPNPSTRYLPAFQCGHQMKNEARFAYLKLAKASHKNVSVQACRLFVLTTKAYIGASPDGLVTCDCCGIGILEIKCPISVAHLSPNESNVAYLKKSDSNEINLNRNHPYYSQVQHYMGVTRRLWCDFFVYSRHGQYIERILFDPTCWKDLETSGELFFKGHVGPKLIEMNKSDKLLSNSEVYVMCCICECFFQSEKGNNVDFTCDDCNTAVQKL